MLATILLSLSISSFFNYPQLLSIVFDWTSTVNFWHQKFGIASFRKSIDALKEAGLADSEVLEIMPESVDGQMLTKKSYFNKKSGQELPTKNIDATNETPSVRKRKADVLSAEKQPKTISKAHQVIV